jgi:hypothetical protein
VTFIKRQAEIYITPLPADEWLSSAIIEVIDDEKDWGKGKGPEHMNNFIFEVDGYHYENGNSVKVRMSCSDSLFKAPPGSNKKTSRLYNLGKALLGEQVLDVEIDENEGYDTEGLIGIPCFIMIEHDAKDSGSVYAKIVRVKRDPNAPKREIKPQPPKTVAVERSMTDAEIQTDLANTFGTG